MVTTLSKMKEQLSSMSIAQQAKAMAEINDASACVDKIVAKVRPGLVVTHQRHARARAWANRVDSQTLPEEIRKRAATLKPSVRAHVTHRYANLPHRRRCRRRPRTTHTASISIVSCTFRRASFVIEM